MISDLLIGCIWNHKSNANISQFYMELYTNPKNIGIYICKTNCKILTNFIREDILEFSYEFKEDFIKQPFASLY